MVTEEEASFKKYLLYVNIQTQQFLFVRIVPGEQQNFDAHSLSKLSLLVGNKLTGNPQFIALKIIPAAISHHGVEAKLGPI